MVSIDRDRGILSEADRRYALNTEEWSKGKSRPATNQRKSAITDRVRNSILDLRHLANKEFPEELLKSIFYVSEQKIIEEKGGLSLKQMGSVGDKYIDPDIEEGFIAGIALMYRVFGVPSANSIIEQGLEQAMNDFYPKTEVVDSTYDPDLQSPEKAHELAKNYLEDGLMLSDEQVRLLIERGEVDSEKVIEHVQRDNKERHADRYYEQSEYTRSSNEQND